MNKNLIIITLILLLGLFMRTFQLIPRFYYNHDNDLSSWIVKDMIIDGHPRLIGQETSSQGIFIGPLFYYSLVPLYIFSTMYLPATLAYPIFIGLFSIFSIYYVFYKLWGKTPAIFGGLLYASSYAISSIEREVVPTTPVFLWTIWCLYAFHLLRRGQKEGILLTAVLGGLAWHINLSLGILAILLLATLFISLARYSLKDFVIPIVIGTILITPLLLFEIRHDYIHAKSLFGTFSSKTEIIARTPLEKTVHVIGIATKNANWLFWDRPPFVSQNLIPGFLVIAFLFLCWKHPQYRTFGIFITLWSFLTIYFFIRHPINISEYYLNGLTILWISLGALILTQLKRLGLLVVFVIVFFNIWRLLESTPNTGGYLARRAIVDYIVQDAKTHNYPCISISYIVQPGNDLGYRFLFYKKKLHVNRPISGSPVYSIVFPHTMVDRLDKSFGSLGLVLPDYSRYTESQTKESCSGENSNITDPMFGFTK